MSDLGSKVNGESSGNSEKSSGKKTMKVIRRAKVLNAEQIKNLASELNATGSDKGFAELVLRVYGDRIRRVEGWGQWLIYDATKGVWVRTGERQKQFFIDVANKVTYNGGLEAPLGHMKRINPACEYIKSDPGISTDIKQIEANPMILNLANGVLDLGTGEFMDHDPKFLTTKQAAVAYDPAADCPRWRADLAKYLPDPQVRAYIQRFLGTALRGLPMTEAILCHGDGANGKTTVLAAVARVLGDYATKLPNGFVAETKNDKHPTELTLLHGSRLAIASETKMRDRLDEAKMKSIQGDGQIMARGMGENFWCFEPTHNLALCVNHLPSMEGRDDGIWRRFRFVEWSYSVPEPERVEDYDKILFEAEGSGILNWLLEGLEDYKTNGMRPPEAVLEQGRRVRDMNDWPARLANLYTVYEPGSKVRLDDRIHRLKLSAIHEVYVSQCRANGSLPMESNKTGKMIRQAFDKIGAESKEVHNTWWIKGVRLKTEADLENELDGIGG